MNEKWRWVKYAKYLTLLASLLASALGPYFLENDLIKSKFLEANGWWIIAGSILLSVVLEVIWDIIVNKEDGFTKGHLERIKRCIVHELEQVHACYAGFFNRESPEIVPNIRINLMILTRKENKSFMKIHACYTIDQSDAYSTAEKEFEWGYNSGCCGKAWASKEQRYFPSDSFDGEIFTQKFTDEQINFTKRAKSILSTPILKDDKVIAILNLDSEESINVVKFKDTSLNSTIQEEARKLTSLIDAPIILTDGVRIPRKKSQNAKQKIVK